jgi:hypothetical protein
MRRPRDSTLGADPLASVFPRSSTGPLRQQEVSRSARAITVGVSLDPEVLERARNAAYWTPGLTLTDLANHALAAAVDDLEHERGHPFPARGGKASLRRPLRALVANPQDNTAPTP